MPAEEDDIARLQAAVQAAEAETAEVRRKLHAAIKKGKAIEGEKQAHAGQVQHLQKQLSSLQGLEAEKAAQASQIQQLHKQLSSLQEAPQPQDVQLQGVRAQLAAVQQQLEQHQQQAAAAADAQGREVWRARQDASACEEHIARLDEMLKAQQRSASALQGEVVMAQAAAETHKQQAQDAQRPLQQLQASSPGLAQPSAAAEESTGLRCRPAFLPDHGWCCTAGGTPGVML